MKKILLVGINARYTHQNLAIRYLRNFVAELNFDVTISEYSINQNQLDILEEIVDKKPDIIAISVYIWNVQIVKFISSHLKNILPKTKIVLGGPEASYNSNLWLNNFPHIDFIIFGAGEAGFKYLLENNFQAEKKIINIKNPPFHKIPFPYLTEDFSENRYLYYEASRGCQFQCSYCISSRNDQKLEFRKIEDVKKELNFMLKFKPKIIKFVDRTFNANSEFSRQIWEFIISQKTSTKFHFEIFPNLLTDADLEVLTKIPRNLFQFEIGIQSTNFTALKTINRSSKWRKTKKNITKLLRLKNIHFHLDFIAGLPFEDFESVKKSIDEILSLKPNHFQLGFLKILPGTEMAEKKELFEMITMQNPPYQVLQNKWLNFAELSQIRQVENEINIFYNSEKYQHFINNLSDEFNSNFEMFTEIAKFRAELNFEKNTKNWQKNSQFLLKFIKQNFCKMHEFYADCLRFDWCHFTKSHYYPSFLDNNILKKAKNIGRNYLKKSENNSKKFITFLPISAKFQSKYMKKNKLIIFVENKKIVI